MCLPQMHHVLLFMGAEPTCEIPVSLPHFYAASDLATVAVLITF